MKLRTSYFNTTVFRKNITRFAPAWILYTLCLLLGLMIMAESGNDYWTVSHLASCIQIMPTVNLGYALICALMLFGDLYNARLCNALHAMPLRREGWFLTNFVSGLLFSLVPSLIMTLLALPLCAMSVVTGGWQVPLYWLLGTNLQFLAFFGIAVFCAFCVGSRFAMAVLYGLLNFGALIAYWMVDTLYTPMLYGVSTRMEPFARLFPLSRMIESGYLYCFAERNFWGEIIGGTFEVGEGWGVLWLWAAVGAALAAAALVLYRRRKLEAAGDFLAFESMEPVFLVVYTLTVGVGFHFVQNLFIGGTGILWLFIGLIVGFFTGRMLLERSVRVVRKKTILACAGLIAAVAASLLIPAFDLLGIEGWIPDQEEIKSVSIYNGHVSVDYARIDSSNGGICLTEEADIETVLAIHQRALEEKQYFTDWDSTTYAYHYQMVHDETPAEFYILQYTLCYELTDGRQVYRQYYTYLPGETAEILRPWFSDFRMVMGLEESQIPALAGDMANIYLDGNFITEELTDAQILELLEAIRQDCAEGNMAQRWAYHAGVEACSLEFETAGRDDAYYWHSVTVYEDAVHTMQWLKDNGLEAYMYMYSEDYVK